MSGKGRKTGAVSLGSQLKTEPVIAGREMGTWAGPILSVGVRES